MRDISPEGGTQGVQRVGGLWGLVDVNHGDTQVRGGGPYDHILGVESAEGALTTARHGC